jgi:MFS family permease
MRDALAAYTEVSDPRSVGMISLSHGVNEFYSVVVPPIIPLLVTDLSITYAEAGLLLTVFFAMYFLFQLPAGLLADRIGKTRLLVGGLAATAGGVALAAAAPGYDALVAAQIVAGIGGSTYHPAGMSLISDVENEATEGRAMGVFGVGGVAGTASAPLVVGGLGSLFGWRTALGVAAAVGGLATVVVFVRLQEPGDGGDDAPGDRDEHEPRPDGGDPGALGRLRAGIERVLRFRFTPRVLLLVLLTALLSFQIRAVVTFATSFLFESFGGSNSRANAVFFVMLAAGGASSLWVGGLADRFDRSRIGVAAAGLTAALLFASGVVATLLGDAGTAARTATLGALFVPLGFVVYGCLPVKNAMLSEEARADFSGGLFGVTQTASAVGSAAGPALVGYVATAYGLDVAFPAIGLVSVGILATFAVVG